MKPTTQRSTGSLSGLQSLLAGLETPKTDSEQATLDLAGESGDVTKQAEASTPAPKPEKGKSKKQAKASAPQPAPNAQKGKKKPEAPPAAKPAKKAAVSKAQPSKEVPVAELIPQSAVKAAGGTTGEPQPEAQATPKPAQPRVFFGRDKVRRLQANLGDDFGKFMLLTTADSELEGNALQDKVKANQAAFKKLAVKVQNRATNIVEFVSGKSTKLNEVIVHALRLLGRDGKITTGDQGTLHQRLLKRPYKPDAARAMGNSTMGALKALEIVKLVDKQHFVPNKDSTLLALLSEKMGLPFVDYQASIAEEDAADKQRLVDLKTKKAEPAAPVAEKPPQEAASEASGDAAVSSLIDQVLQSAGDRELAMLDAASF